MTRSFNRHLVFSLNDFSPGGQTQPGQWRVCGFACTCGVGWTELFCLPTWGDARIGASRVFLLSLQSPSYTNAPPRSHAHNGRVGGRGIWKYLNFELCGPYSYCIQQKKHMCNFISVLLAHPCSINEFYILIEKDKSDKFLKYTQAPFFWGNAKLFWSVRVCVQERDTTKSVWVTI